jgi:hypothetical protein
MWRSTKSFESCVCSSGLQVDRAVSHFGRNSPRFIPPFLPIIPVLVTELIRALHQTSVTPQRTTRRSAPHKRKIIWSACTIPKRHVENVLVRHLPFNTGSITDCTRESHQGGVCQEGTAPSCRGQKDGGCVGGRCYNGGRSHSTRWG